MYVNGVEINLKGLREEVYDYFEKVEWELGNNDETYAEVYGYFITEKDEKHQETSVEYELIILVDNDDYSGRCFERVILSDSLKIGENEEIWEVINKLGTRVKKHKLRVWECLGGKSGLVKLGKDCIE